MSLQPSRKSLYRDTLLCLGYADKLASIAFVHLMKGLMDGSIAPMYARFPVKVEPIQLDSAGITCFIRRNPDNFDQFEVYSGQDAHLMEGVNQISWVEWHRHVLARIKMGYAKLNNASHFIRQGTPINTTRQFSKDHEFEIPVHQLHFFCNTKEVGCSYEFYYDGRLMKEYRPHIHNLIHDGYFDPYFDTDARDLNDNPTFPWGLPYNRDLSEFAFVGKVRY